MSTVHPPNVTVHGCWGNTAEINWIIEVYRDDISDLLLLDRESAEEYGSDEESDSKDEI